MTRYRFGLVFLVVGFLSLGCSSHRDFPESYSVYQVVLADLLDTVNGSGAFNGTEISVSPNQCDGKSNGFSSSVTVDKALLQKLDEANQKKHEFEQTAFTLEGVRIEEIPSFNGLYYYGEGNRPQNLKCLVQFWHAGFSDDGKTAVVKFSYGPSPHGAIGTYLLQRTKDRWKIVRNVIDYYM